VAFERIQADEVYAGGLIQVRRDVYRHEDGAEVVREVAIHPGAAVIVPFDGRAVHLVEQPREIVGEEALLELPAGKLDPGETPEQAAHRELVEEVGQAAGTLELLTVVYASPGFTNETFHLFLATDLSPAAAPKPDEDERITIRMVSHADLATVIDQVRDAKTLIGLLLLQRRLLR
jgi:ADP-ribose pyrophosphatase